MTKGGSSEDRGYYYPQDPKDQESQDTAPLYQQPAPSAPQYYGTFQGSPGYPQPVPPGFPQPVHPSQAPQYRQEPVQGYPIVEGMPAEEQYRRLPCCGIGIGWFLFIIGWFLASIPWYVGAFLLICTRHDYRERVGLTCCAIAAILSLIAVIVGGTKAADV